MKSQVLKTTLKIQPAVILFSCVSILARLASRHLPQGELTFGEKLEIIVKDWRLAGLVAAMFLILDLYAVIWQLLIKSAFSQILLKKSTLEKHASFLGNFLNVKVLTAYAIFALTLFLNIYAYTGIPYKFASVLNASAYIFTMLFSAWLLKDKISWQCAAGSILIVAGIMVYVW